MWIFDSYYKGAVHLWARERGLVRTAAAYPPSFYLHLPDPAAHRGMIEALESLYRLEEASFCTIYGRQEGYLIYADRSVAEKIEIQTRYAAELYNVDVRRDQQYLAERDIFPCGGEDESRFSPDFESPLRAMRLHFSGDPLRRRAISRVELDWGEAEDEKGTEDGGEERRRGGWREMRDAFYPISWSWCASTIRMCCSSTVATSGCRFWQRRRPGWGWRSISAEAAVSGAWPHAPTGATAGPTTGTWPSSPRAGF